MAMAPSVRRQQGFFLIALTAALAVIAFGFITAYSGLLAKKEQRALLDSQKSFMEQARSSLQTAYEMNAAAIERGDTSPINYRNVDSLLSLAGVSKKWGMQTAMSNTLVAGSLHYSVVALWLPTESDSTNPPSFDPNTGVFVSCSVAGAPCQPRAYVVVSGLDIQKRLEEKAIRQLNELASFHQTYFKSKMLMDPDRNISNNYFRPEDGVCSSTNGIPCIDTCMAEKDTEAVSRIGVPQGLLVNPWGIPLETSNAVDCGDPGSAPLPQASPYRMSFKSATPWGSSYTIYAIQPI